jgi:hypothetical protein
VFEAFEGLLAFHGADINGVFSGKAGGTEVFGMFKGG